MRRPSLRSILVPLCVVGLVFGAALTGWLLGWRGDLHPRGGWPQGRGPLRVAATTVRQVPALPSEGLPSNAVLLLGDGMGAAALAAARVELEGAGGRLAIDSLPITGMVLTHSVDDLITDSAAAATAMTTGVKTRNGRISIDAAGNPLPTLGEAALAKGMSLGLVTSSYLCDATPTAFVGHAASRRECLQLLAQMAASGAEVLLGEMPPASGLPVSRREVEEIFRAQGFTLARSARELAGLRSLPRGSKVVGLFASGSVADPGEDPDLASLAAFALARLHGSPGGFLLLVEEEEIDTGGHHHDLARVVAGVASLDRAAGVVLEVAAEDGSTLVVATGDHETGGLTLLSGREGGRLGVRWGTPYHSAVPVPLLAGGPGARELGGVQDNTELPRRLAHLLGLELGAPPAASPATATSDAP